MDLDALKQELQSNSAVQSAAQSAEAQKLLRSMDAAGIEDAAKRGDAAALKQYLMQALSTPEGQALARRVQKAVKRDG